MSQDVVITRFAPSPTGGLHIGSARTALFNYIHAKKMHGKFLLRIEDTDRERSKPEYEKEIIESLKWLGIDWDDEIYMQFASAPRHREVAHHLVSIGKAYRCFLTKDELVQMRGGDGGHAHIVSPWRDRQSGAPTDAEYVIRLKVDHAGDTGFEDDVLGYISAPNSEIDDMVLLRSDGSPTYMLSVVVDDHDMKITNVIRGADHTTNTFRQIQIYKAMGWGIPKFAHIPLILGEDGAKLSKRHGATSVFEYRDNGFLPEAICNYLMHLGIGYQNIDIFSKQEAQNLFDIRNVNPASARFDTKKLLSINEHYLRMLPDAELAQAVVEHHKLSDNVLIERVNRAVAHLKQRSSTMMDICNLADMYINKPVGGDELDANSAALARAYLEVLAGVGEEDWTRENLEAATKEFIKARNIKISDIGPSIRVLCTGRKDAPAIYDILYCLGKSESIDRLHSLLW